MRRSAVHTSPAGSPSRLGSGATAPLTLRACHEASPRGFTAVAPTRHSPPPVSHAAGLSGPDGVLETPPLPVTPPPCRDRWHDLMAASPRLVRVQPYNLHPRVATTLALSGGGRPTPNL